MPERRTTGSERGRIRVDWEKAFQFFASLPPEERVYRRVADEFGLSIRTVERHGREGRWRQRVRAIDEHAASEADERLGRTRAEQLADVQRLIEASFVTYARQLASGQVRVTASDLVGLIKIAMQLHGEPSKRVEVVSSSSEWVQLRSRILDALAPFPEAQIALAEALETEGNRE